MSCNSRRSVRLFFTSAALTLCAVAAASAQNVGWLGPSYSGAGSYPTGTKPQSKLWWNDGSWWGCLWSASAQSFMIHRLDVPTQAWIDTGTAVDSRPLSHADCLWDGSKLYVASHQYTGGLGGPGHALELFRYSYNPNSDVYSLDVGFPALIGDAKTETLVIDKDSTGTLWAVWMAGFRVWIAHTQGDDRSWSIPIVHPRNTSDIAADDIASVVRFGGNKIGVLWSDQVLDAFRFTFHQDGAPDTTWSLVGTVASGVDIADDHISLRASTDGRIFAALKSNTDEVRLLVRGAGGGWTSHLVAANADHWTRPIVVLDEEHRNVHVFGTSPLVLGTIYRKFTSMDAPAFAVGIGTPVIQDGSGPSLNDATSTKQSVSGATGLVVLASHQTSQHYAHHHETLGGPTQAPPTAVFHADPITGYAPLRVQFLDASTGSPTGWSWTFGDGGSSTARHPVHTYAQAGLYTVSLQVTNGLGGNQATRTNLIDVDVAPTSLAVRPIADGQVREGSPDTNYGSLDTMRVRDNEDSDYHAYVKFFVPPSSSQVTSARVRLFCAEGSPDGGSVHLVGDGWDEPTFDWGNAPALVGAPIATIGTVATGATVELNVGSVVDGSGTWSFGIQSADSNSVMYSTRQGTQSPELLLDLQPSPPAPPTAGFEENRPGGIAPVTLQFFDTSNGPVGGWLWDFGDGSTSTVQNPSHVYAQPGIYTVSLTVSNSNGGNTLTKPGIVRVFSDRGGPVGHAGTEPPSLPPIAPLVAGAPGPGPRQFQLVLEGSLDDVLARLDERLAEAGFEILRHSVRCDERGVAVVELQLRRGSHAGVLELHPETPDRVAGVLSLSLD